MKMKKAFTLVEMIVVVAVIAILMASIGVAVNKAQLRSRIARAETEAGEITNAIHAYGNYVDTGIPERSDVDADEMSLAFILGGGTDRAGGQVPVLYNASVTGGKILDPWGKPYRVRIMKLGADTAQDQVARGMTTGVLVPNRYNKMAEGRR